MLKNFFILCLLCFSSLYELSSVQITLNSGEIISLEECEEKDLINCQIIFVNAFSKAYDEFTPQELGVEDKLLFLLEAFSDVYEDVRQGHQKIIVAKKEDLIIGFVGFKKTEIPYEIYISQLAVDPNYWRHGIGKHLVFSSLGLYDDLKKLVVIPRKINLIARKFYESLGFKESAYMHPGYNPERYIGYEWSKP